MNALIQSISENPTACILIAVALIYIISTPFLWYAFHTAEPDISQGDNLISDDDTIYDPAEIERP